jgi:hypothetical protein
MAPNPYRQPYMVPPMRQPPTYQRPPPPPPSHGPPRQDQQRRLKGGRGKKSDRVATPWQEGVLCQICKKEGHSAGDCWWRYGDDDDEDTPPGSSKGA